MASDAEELRKAQRLNMARSRPAAAMAPYDRLKRANATKKNSYTMADLKEIYQGSNLKKDSPATQRAIEIATGRKRKPKKRNLPSIAGSEGAATPRTVIKRVGNSYSGYTTPETPGIKGAPGVTGFASAAEQLKQLRAMNEGGEQRPEALAPPDRGFQYQPSQWAQQTALRNARVGFNATANKYRDQRGLGAAQAQLGLEMERNPALQGLERSKMYQDNITADQQLAMDQRSQDVRSFDALRRNQSAERIATNRDTAAAQAAQARNLFETQKFGVERSDRLRQQQTENQRQNYQDTQDIIGRIAVNPDGTPDPVRNEGLNRMMANSGALNLPPAEAQQVLSFFDQFSAQAKEAGGIQEAGFPTLAKIFDFFKADVGDPQTAQEVFARMRQVRNDTSLQRSIGLKKNEVSLLDQLKF